MKLGTTLEMILDRYKMTQRTLSELTQLSPATISHIIQNHKVPRDKHLIRICEVLQVNYKLVRLISLESYEIDPKKRELFRQIEKPLKELLITIL